MLFSYFVRKLWVQISDGEKCIWKISLNGHSEKGFGLYNLTDRLSLGFSPGQ